MATGLAVAADEREAELAVEFGGRKAPRRYDREVAYDELLAARIRELLRAEPDVTEKHLFGGLAFLVGGNMAIAASGQGGVLVRVDPAHGDRLLATTAAYPMEMRGRSMRGWLRVDTEHLRTQRQLQKWVDLGVSFARTLAPKTS